MALIMSKFKNEAYKHITKTVKYKIKMNDFEPLLEEVAKNPSKSKLDVNSLSRDMVIKEYIKDWVLATYKNKLEEISSMYINKNLEEGEDPYGNAVLPRLIEESVKALDEIESCGNSVNAKIDILKSKKNNPILKDIFKYTYDYRLAYGIKHIEIDMESEPGAKTYYWSEFTNLLDRLSTKPSANGKDVERMHAVLGGLPKSYRKWAYRVLTRDLKIGMKDANIKRVWKDVVPTFGVSLCSTIKRGAGLEESLNSLPKRLLVEPKYDGLRTIVVITDSSNCTGKVYSRKGLPQDHLHYLVDEASKAMNRCGISSGVLDCEAVSTISTRYSDAVSAKNTMSMDNRPLELKVFDFINLEDFDAGAGIDQLHERRSVIESLFDSSSVSVAPSFRLAPCSRIGVKDRAKKIMSFYSKCRADGYEGVVIKDADSTYASGEKNRKRSGFWRIKPFETIDIKITGCFPGKKGTKYEKVLGGFTCSLKNGTEIRVGGGFSDQQRSEFWKNRKHMVGKTIEIERQENTPGIKTRHASFIRLREDK